MSETALLTDVVSSLAARHCAPASVQEARGGWLPSMWEELAAVGLVGLGVGEEVGGGGGSWGDAARVARLLASVAAPVPFAETLLLAGWLRELAGFSHDDEPATVLVAAGAPPELRGGPGAWTLEHEFVLVPWARVAKDCLSVLPVEGGGCAVVRVRAQDTRIVPGLNVAGEPRDTVAVSGRLADDDVATGVGVTHADLVLRAAAARAVMIAGALESVVPLTRDYVHDRRQFGRSLDAFQSVKERLALLASEAMAAATVAEIVAERPGDELAVAAAKVRTAIAATHAARLSHQLHGAIGLTREYRLALLTERLWSWRDEFGSQRAWQERLGRLVRLGDRGLWELLTEA